MRSTRLVAWWSAAVAVVALAACGSDAAAWRAHLAAPVVQRIAGTWRIDLRQDTGANAGPPPIRGQLALVVNDARLDASGLGARPEFFGTYDIDFSTLPFQPGVMSGVPTVIGVVRGDSLWFKLAPASDLPVDLRGSIAGDSIVGRWSVHERSGPGAVGDFVLRRH